MATEKTVIVANLSKRLWIIGGIHISPTAAVAVPESVFKSHSVQAAIEDGELAEASEEKAPQIVTTAEEAAKIQAEQKRNANKGK
jgi:hypothetical protein